MYLTADCSGKLSMWQLRARRMTKTVIGVTNETPPSAYIWNPCPATEEEPRMQQISEHYAARIVGRLFSKGGRLHLIVDADPESGFARVSCQMGDANDVVTIPVSDCIRLLANSKALKLDGLNARQTDYRVIERDQRWFFKTREGQFGPFADRRAAERELKQHILLAQEEGRSGRPQALQAVT